MSRKNKIGMNLRLLLARLTEVTDIRVLKAYVLSARAKNFNPTASRIKLVSDRLFFLVASLALPFIVVPRFHSRKKNEFMLIEPSGSLFVVSLYRHFIKSHCGIDVEDYHWRKGISIYKAKDIILYLKTWFTLIRISIICLFMYSNISIRPFWKYYIFLTQVQIDRPEIVFIVDYSGIENYLLTLGLRNITKVIYIPTNSRLFDMRYGYYENVTVILTSCLQESEIKCYIDFGWIRLLNTSIENWGHLFNIYSSKESKDAIYDLGYFSSGEWGRNGGVFRTNNLKEVIQNSQEDNEYWQLSESILMFLIMYARRNDLTLKIFLHPFEKELIKRFGLYPPYAKHADGRNMFIDENYDSYFSNFFEAKIGFVTISSILYDRVQFNLKTFYFSPKQSEWSASKFYYNKKYLPIYSEYAYESIDQLEHKLDQLFVTDRND